MYKFQSADKNSTPEDPKNIHTNVNGIHSERVGVYNIKKKKLFVTRPTRSSHIVFSKIVRYNILNYLFLYFKVPEYESKLIDSDL